MSSGRAATLAVLTVIVSTIPRLATAAGWLDHPFDQYAWSDLQKGYAWLLEGGRVPYWDTAFYYPPLVGYVAGVFSIATRSAVVYVALWGCVVAVAAALVADRLEREVGSRTAIAFWAMSPQLLFHSGANLDVIPAGLVLGSALAARRHRADIAIAALAVGTLVKVFPIAVAPMELARAWRTGARQAFILAAVFVGIVGGVALPSLLAPWPSTLTAPDYAARVSFDSVWGLLIKMLVAAGITDAPTYVAAVTLTGAVATYALALSGPARRSADPAVGAALAVLTVLLWTRLYSPQYSLWVLPLLALLRVDVVSFALLTAADVATYATVPLAIVYWDPDDARTYWLVVAVAVAILIRHAALIRLWLRLAPRGSERTVDQGSVPP